MGSSPWGQAWGSSWGHQHRGGPWGAGPPPWVAGLFGMTQHGHVRGPKVRRGDVRAAILDVLAVEPMNGYQIIQQIAERSGGAWKPSPGSVYPTLQQLEDEGLVEGSEAEGRRTVRLTEEGRTYVAEHPEELADTWRSFDEPAATGSADFKPLIGQVMAAVWQIIMSGNQQQQAEAAEILSETRRKLYGLLAEGEPE
jgi:DNA-binding PadR family transcriptional regulator